MKIFLVGFVLFSAICLSCERDFHVSPKKALPTSAPCSGAITEDAVIGCGESLPCSIGEDLEITCSTYTDLSVIEYVGEDLTTCVTPTKLPKIVGGDVTVDPSICK